MTDNDPQRAQRLSEACKEADALVWYFARHCPVHADENATAAYNALVAALSMLREKGDEESYRGLMEAYDLLSDYTYRSHEVHGKSILDTTRPPARHVKRLWDKRVQPVTLGAVFFVAAVLLQLLEVHFAPNCTVGAAGSSGASSIPDPAPSSSWISLAKYSVPLLLPVAWGALGACTALAKSVSDRLSAMSYEENRMHGLMPRIFLGAALALVLHIFVFVENPTCGTNSGVATFGPIAGAFLAGLFVQHIYELFENMMHRLSTAMSPRPPEFQSNRSQSRDATD